jgi:hypothetical protein
MRHGVNCIWRIASDSARAAPPFTGGRIMVTRRSLVGVVVLLAATAIPARADLFQDFNNQNDNGLTRYNPLAAFGQGGTYSFPLLSPGNYGYELTQAGLPADNPAGRARMGSSVTGQTFTDVFETVDVVNFDSNLGQVFGLGARVNNVGLGTTSGYALVYSTPTGEGSPAGEFSFDRVTNEAATDIGTQASITLVSGHSYRFVLRTSGANMSGQLLDLANPGTILASVNATDSTYASGTAGVITAAGDAATTSGINVIFDNLLVQSVPEPSTLTLSTVALLIAGIWARCRAACQRVDSVADRNRL